MITLSNGLTIASLENYNPVTTITTREHTLYAVQTTRDVSDIGVEYLADSVSSSLYKPWEVQRTGPRLKLELATRTPADQALELLHSAAFRSGLGNSLYCPSHKVGSHGTADLATFTSKHFKSGRAALLGVGISHQALTKFAELLKLEAGSGPCNLASKFSAAELRTEPGGDRAYVAVASQTAGAVNVAEAMTNLLLQRILGSGPSVKYGLGSGLLAQAAASVGGNSAASGVCQMYSDAGLIGALMVSEAASAPCCPL